MKPSTLKNLTHAHAWLGLIISGVLMVVFVCGTLSFFRHNIMQWDQHHNLAKALPDKIASSALVIEHIIANGHILPDDHGVYLSLPSAQRPYFEAYYEIEDADGGHQDQRQAFDAASAEPLAVNTDNYYLADMLYRLHIDLLLPGGRELVGVVSLLFLVLVMSGLLMQLRKLVSHFYQYRINKRKDTFLDGHNLIGVTTLPYTFIYALTGVMFNLGIVYQIGLAGAMFGGDVNRMFAVAGFSQPPAQEASGQPMPLANLDAVLASAQKQMPDYTPGYLNIDGFGDQNARVEVGMYREDQLVRWTNLTYQLESLALIKRSNPADNPVGATYFTLSSLHFGDFGGVSLQFVYFIIGLGCCYLILTGNLIWLEKRQGSKQQSARGLHIVRAMTIALSCGTLLAVALSFLGARFLPAAYARTDLLPWLFLAGIMLSLVHALFVTQARRTMVLQLCISALLFALCPLYDGIWALLGHPPLGPHLNDVWLVNLVLVMVALFCLRVARQHHVRTIQQQASVSDAL